MKDLSEMPHFAKPLFLAFDAQVEFHPVRLVSDLKKAGLKALAKTGSCACLLNPKLPRQN
jgi:hypothetical protein